MQSTARITTLLASTLLILGAGAAQAGDPAAGRAKSETCAACHGERGNSPNSMNPVLAGQHESYLYYALKTYKSGERENAVMNGMVSGLSDQDLRDLAAFYASQDGLFTITIDRGAAAD